MVKPVMHIEVPYGGTGSLELDPSSRRVTHHSGPLQWLLNEADGEELPRILTSAVLLFAAEAGSIGQCLDTAIVWERG